MWQKANRAYLARRVTPQLHLILTTTLRELSES